MQQPEEKEEESESDVERPPNPILGASILDHLTFSWPRSIIDRGLAGPIRECDIADVVEAESSQHNRLLLEEAWENEIEYSLTAERSPSLHRALLKLYFKKLWFIQPLIGLTSVSRIGQALALGRLIQHIEDNTCEREGYTWAGILVCCAIVPLVSHHQTYFRTWRTGMQLRIATVATIYAKSLRLSSIGGNKGTSSGELLNLASNDVERFLFASLFLSYLFWAPLEALVVLFVGVDRIGSAFAAGYVVLFIFVPMQFFLGKRFAKLRSQVAALTDKRVSLLSQAIAGVRVMKMSGWENEFRSKVDATRSDEVQKVKSASRFRALNEAIFFSTNVSVTTVIFVVHVLLGNKLTPRDVFTVFTLINVVQFTMTKFFAYAVMSVSECYVSVHRIQQFLELPEIEDSQRSEKEASELELQTKPIVTIERLSSYWEMDLTKRVQHFRGKSSLRSWFSREEASESREKTVKSCDSGTSQKSIALVDVSLEFNLGKLYCLIGAVGSGKSALLQTLAGELLPASGTVERRASSIAYASQDPWIMDGTVRENVVMGLPFDAVRYHEILMACGLGHDLRQFHSGDETIVGDRGVQCSGGQRARIGLARALYRNADMILLDDPLSAVDSKVGKLIFQSAIKELCVRRGKCVVLATHQHQLLVDEICILMNHGCVRCVGSYEECVHASGGLLKQGAPSEDLCECKCGEASLAEAPQTDERRQARRKNKESVRHAETTRQGEVETETWLAYVKALGGFPVVLGLLLLFAVTQGALLVTIAFIGKWAELPEQQSSPFMLAVVGLVPAVICLATLRAILCFSCTIAASQRLHDQMTMSVLRAKIEFFDTNPAGRILNRFSADVGSNDDQLPSALSDTVTIGFIVLGGFVTAASVLPFLLIVFPPLLWYFIRVRRMFVTTSRELKRYEGMARSPIYAMMSESINGIASIRANGSIDYFLEKFQKVQNAHSRAFFSFIATTRWLNFRLESITMSFLSLSCFLAVLFHSNRWFEIDPSILGLALTLLLQLSGLLQWAVRQSAEVLNLMVAVERVSSYGNLPPEGVVTLPSDKDLDEWPFEGRLELRDLTVKYRDDLPAVLKGVSFTVEGGHRVGIVGRTGSGKSTIVQAVFRLLEAEAGSIFLDGTNVASVGLHTLRKRISVIPQSPVLFSATTIRENLDPFCKYEDDCINKALKDVQMSSVIDALPGGLDTIVAESGSNFSVGQRQLLCVARSILEKNRILVLDEPTANVDNRTDVLLQNAVATSFPGATVIAIAHRLDTVIDFDRILVVGDCQVLEYGTPHELLSRDGPFSAMVADTGMSMSRQLRKRAAKNEVTNKAWKASKEGPTS